MHSLSTANHIARDHFIAVNGDTIRDLLVEWRASNLERALVVSCGSTKAIEALRAGKSTITFEASTARLDSITKLRGSTHESALR